MISQKNITDLYNWAVSTHFPLKKAPTTEGYSNNPVHFCWLKKIMKTTSLRKSIIKDLNIQNILNDDDILFCTIASFDPNTKLGPHKDPNVYKHLYKRIQIPLIIPEKEKCYMIWKGNKVYWEEGNSQVVEVMDYVHEGYNYSNKPMKFLFLDVKKSTQVEIK
jgi:hypothetical protein